MLAGARLQRRRRQLQQPQQSRRRQAFPWPMNADPPPPPWVWMVPGSTGLFRLGAGVAPPPVLLASAQPAAAPLLARLPGWPAPGEPLLPLLPLPSAPDHAVHHYPLLPGQVTSRLRSPLRLRITGPFLSPVWVGAPPFPGGFRFSTPSGLPLAVIHWQESSCFDVRFCLGSFFIYYYYLIFPPWLSSERLRPCIPSRSRRAWTQLSPGAVQSAVLKSPPRITARQPTIVAAIASKLILLQSPPD